MFVCVVLCCVVLLCSYIVRKKWGVPGEIKGMKWGWWTNMEKWDSLHVPSLTFVLRKKETFFGHASCSTENSR